MILIFLLFLYCKSAIVSKKTRSKQPFPLYNRKYENSVPAFGKEMKEKEFTLKTTSHDLNHGSYGAPSIAVQDSYQYYFNEVQKNPEIFYRYSTKDYFRAVIDELSSFVNSPPSNIVLIENASTGINSVLRSIRKWGTNDGLLYITNEYPMTKNVIFWLESHYGVNLYEVDIDLNFDSDKYILERVEDVLKQNAGRITFAVFDHISSTPAIIWPIEKLTELCHNYGVLVLIDGAHAVGQIHLDFQDYKPDFYLSNIHKWMLGVQDYHDITFPAVIGVNNNTFESRFVWTGTRDWCSFLSITEALQFREWIGHETIMNHNDNLCIAVNDLFCNSWNVTRPVPKEMTASLINVEIPCNIPEEQGCYDWSIGTIETELVDREFFTVIFGFKNTRYLRLSCQIYNWYQEYVDLKDTLEELIKF